MRISILWHDIQSVFLIKRNNMIRKNLCCSSAILSIGIFSLCVILSTGELFGQSQRIEKGDILEIHVYGYEEFSRTVMVEPDGTIDFPLVSNIPVQGLSLDELREILRSQAAKLLGERPIITVRFSLTMNVGVTVLGQVAIPGEYLVAKRATVQGAITRAGGATPRAQLEAVKLIRKKNGETETMSIDMNAFFIQGDPSLLPSLEDGDVIVVPGLPGSYDVKVLGEVQDPGTYQIFSGANLFDALYLAGGPTEDAALNRTRLVTPFRNGSREVQIDINKFLQSEQVKNIPEVKPGDIVYIPTRRKFFRNFISVLRDIATIAWPIVMILYYSGAFERN
jgi:polysaccharide export outer membrane protein